MHHRGNIGADGVACLCEPSHKVQDVSQSANHARARSGRPALLRVMKVCHDFTSSRPPCEAQLLACWCVYIEKPIDSAPQLGRALPSDAGGHAEAARDQCKSALRASSIADIGGGELCEFTSSRLKRGSASRVLARVSAMSR